MTSAPHLAHRDRAAVDRLAGALPHAVLIVAEAGLDGVGAAQHVARRQPSDILNVAPPEGKTIITIEQIRDITWLIRTHAVTRRVIIIKDADSMTDQAQNALLKSLEEPSRGTHFILIAREASLVLPTIRSRCQIMTLHRTSPIQDRAILQSVALPEDHKCQLLFLAAGRPLLLQRLAAQPTLFTQYQTIATDAKQIITQAGTYDALRLLPRYTARADALLLLDMIIQFLKFHVATGGTHGGTSALLGKALGAETALRQNGNVKLALLQLMI